MKSFPHTLYFLSDETEAVFKEELADKKAKERTARYEFTKGLAVKGKRFRAWRSIALQNVEL